MGIGASAGMARWLGVFALLPLAIAAHAETPADSRALVLDTMRPLIVKGVQLCLGSKSVASLEAELPAYADLLVKAGIVPDTYDKDLASKGLAEFTAWGFDGENVPEAVKPHSFYVNIRVQESGGRLTTFCDFTDLKTDPTLPTLGDVEADWLDAIKPMLGGAAVTHSRVLPETEKDSASSLSYFDLSSAETVQSIAMFNAGHKLELTIMRATAGGS